MIDLQVSKSMSRSFVSPAAILNPPDAIWPEGILRPVFASLESSSSWGVLGEEVSMMQLAEFPQALLEMLRLLSARMIRIC